MAARQPRAVWRRYAVALATLAAVAAGAVWLAARPPDVTVAAIVADADTLARGETLLYAGGCISCHRAEENDALSGGRALETPFGTFYAPNITPDTDTGIGAWSDADFVRAFRYGVSPDGDHYYPAFPYGSYTGIRDDDLLALKAYLFSLPAVRRDNRPHALPWYLRWRQLLAGWKVLHFTPGPLRPDPDRAADWNRGAYLVRALGHCAECHTGRAVTGGLRSSALLAGNPDGPDGEAVPNITPHPDDGVGGWSEGDMTLLLEIGMLPDGDFVGGTMSEVIDDNTGRLSDADRRAITIYLRALPPRPSPGG